MSTHTDTEEMETTRSEKLLAAVLAIFLLIGGIWVYSHIGVDKEVNRSTLPTANKADKSAVHSLTVAERKARRARSLERNAEHSLTLKREEYRTAIDAGRPATKLKAEYVKAQKRLENAQLRSSKTTARTRELSPAADAADRRITAAEDKRSQAFASQAHDNRRDTFLLRLVYILATIALGYWLLAKVRRRYPRYLSIALAFVGFAALQSLIMAVHYLGEYVEFESVGPLVISLLGGLFTIAALITLQRYLLKRIPKRRVRKHECPFCGFPVRDSECCEGCGRKVFAECTTCHQKRRVGTAHCGACGAV